MQTRCRAGGSCWWTTTEINLEIARELLSLQARRWMWPMTAKRRWSARKFAGRLLLHGFYGRPDARHEWI